jgi:hypothetical protein
VGTLPGNGMDGRKKTRKEGRRKTRRKTRKEGG